MLLSSERRTETRTGTFRLSRSSYLPQGLHREKPSSAGGVGGIANQNRDRIAGDTSHTAQCTHRRAGRPIIRILSEPKQVGDDCSRLRTERNDSLSGPLTHFTARVTERGLDGR